LAGELLLMWYRGVFMVFLFLVGVLVFEVNLYFGVVDLFVLYVSFEMDLGTSNECSLIRW